MTPEIPEDPVQDEAAAPPPAGRRFVAREEFVERLGGTLRPGDDLAAELRAGPEDVAGDLFD